MSGKSKIHVDSEQLKQLYEVEGLTTRQIAERLGTGSRTITRRLHEFGITPRPPGPERHEMLRNKEWLAAQYATKSSILIAEETGASRKVVIDWLKQHGIERRPRGQNKGKTFGSEMRSKLSASRKGRFTGEANPNWRGGEVSPNTRLRVSYPSKEWSKKVRERDGHKCVECGATGKLHAHHIKPWKQHPELRFDVDNGVTLCPPCHQKAHGFPFPAWAYHGESRTSAKQPEQG